MQFKWYKRICWRCKGNGQLVVRNTEAVGLSSLLACTCPDCHGVGWTMEPDYYYSETED